MKLATALAERADLQRRLSELGKRLNNNAKTQEGEPPAEEPAVLLAEFDTILAQLEELIARINLTNSRVVSDGMTMTELLAKRDCLKSRISILQSFLENASAKVDRYARTELKIVRTVDVADLRKECDRYSRELRETDEKIQSLNWTNDLM